jgi:hypothetical protein
MTRPYGDPLIASQPSYPKENGSNERPSITGACNNANTPPNILNRMSQRKFLSNR